MYDIEFFTNIDEPDSIHACAMYNTGVRVKDMNPGFRNGNIELNNQMKIEEIEQLIHDHFNLHAQISVVRNVRGSRLPFMPNEKLYSRIKLAVRHRPVVFRDVPFGC